MTEMSRRRLRILRDKGGSQLEMLGEDTES